MHEVKNAAWGSSGPLQVEMRTRTRSLSFVEQAVSRSS